MHSYIYFQFKVDELLGDIDRVNTYENDIMILGKVSFPQHIDHIRVIFARLQTEGLKVNASKCSFRLKAIHYLGYVISWEDIKPDIKKFQGIMDLGQPTTMNEILSMIGIVK